ncbi:THUMP domain-containing protein 2 isoform X1 [Protobothrops mucrosquamatus]|uniref:THUMP domain-containing protein 2 isoform X1 n=2 Tax=Protobothrops mucrosquamatus TaxID=103944 RepID=UPI00077592BF|nr:THUMP domain-containing protein 2 isoform X1 [Protobothrops mucrosquamatus]
MADGGKRERPKEARRCSRYFCTAGRGMEPFLIEEVQARLGATQVEYVAGKVFFSTSVELSMLKKLKSAERLFLLLKKCPPLSFCGNKGRIIQDVQKLVNEDPRCWLHTIAVWRSLYDQVAKQLNFYQEYPDSKKQKLEEEKHIENEKQKTQIILETDTIKNQIEDQQKCDTHNVCKDILLPQSRLFLENTPELIQDQTIVCDSYFSFRVSCRCSGILAKLFTAQELGKIIGIALMKNFGWKANLRNPDLEIFVHLNDIYSVIGIPLFRLPLASRAYIKTAGLRSTIAWAMTSLAEIKAGAFVLDPMCGLGTILLEAATEWPNVYYFGSDISDSQLQGAYSNIRDASLIDKIELFKSSVTGLPFLSESIDVILTDIPFGKKFKITEDMKFLPRVFQELERVLCFGGTVVLLLSQELYKCISNGIAHGCQTERSIFAESSTDCRQSDLISVEQDTKEESISCTVSPSSQDARKEHLSYKKADLGSLVFIESFEVSLGKTNAFICKYKKIT